MKKRIVIITFLLVAIVAGIILYVNRYPSFTVEVLRGDDSTTAWIYGYDEDNGLGEIKFAVPDNTRVSGRGASCSVSDIQVGDTLRITYQGVISIPEATHEKPNEDGVVELRKIPIVEGVVKIEIL